MTKIIAYKGFDAELRCRGYQFELNKRFQHQGTVVACESVFHACEYPLDVLSYYPPAISRYGEVELSGDTSKEGKDTKIAAAEITIKAELKIPELIAAAVRYIVERAKRIDGDHASGERELIEVHGDRAIATVSGHWSAATAAGALPPQQDTRAKYGVRKAARSFSSSETKKWKSLRFGQASPVRTILSRIRFTPSRTAS
ncbi:hypothetical protein [Brucella sp. 10RB9213]|uniref:DUF7666 domain-containing protein n=1 Tax=Brucella sp. 10RB9213 TaxID=1844039 RepID=UPI0019D5788F|nr:hypothetical protein [Brucella sp. 10RB9213]